MREGLIDTSKLIPDGCRLKDETIVALKKLEYDYLIARVGLQGTLWGAWASLVVIVLIVLSPMFTPRSIVDGWQIVAIVASMVFSIVFYGTFIFQRALSVAAKVGADGTSISAGTVVERPKRPDAIPIPKGGARNAEPAHFDGHEAQAS